MSAEECAAAEAVTLESCQICGAKFKISTGDLQLHQAQHGPACSAQNNPFKCANCDYSVATREELKFHSKVSYIYACELHPLLFEILCGNADSLIRAKNLNS